MKTVFTSDLSPVLNALARKMQLYVPRRNGDHFGFKPYAAGDSPPDLNPIRACTPVKEFLFPMRELAAVFPEPAPAEDGQPFAVFGLKDCDLRSIAILDKVFLEEEFEDPFYVRRRENMLIIATDCTDPAESCFCNAMGGRGHPESGYDLSVATVKDGWVLQAGSSKGEALLSGHTDLFAAAPDSLLVERDATRALTQKQLEANNADLKFKADIGDVIQDRHDSTVFDDEAATCVECQGCTRVCPTCHCFYLYDEARTDDFTKTRIWDSCMRLSYAAVAGGANPREYLGERLRHRMMHKFAYFLDRYGVNMCVGCGRCVDGEAGGVDIRVVLKRLNDEFKKPRKRKVAK